jgi:hypothetical protein
MARSRLLLLSSLLLLSAAAADCAPGPGRVSPANSAKLRVEAGETLSVEFSPLPDSPRILAARGVAILNLGNVSYAGRPELSGVSIQRLQRGFSVTATVGVQVGKGDLGGGTATLKAWLQSPIDPYSISFDNVPLSLEPACVDAQTRLGVVTRHQLKIDVPSSTSEKQSSLQTEIAVLVVRN